MISAMLGDRERASHRKVPCKAAETVAHALGNWLPCWQRRNYRLVRCIGSGLPLPDRSLVVECEEMSHRRTCSDRFKLGIDHDSIARL